MFFILIFTSFIPHCSALSSHIRTFAAELPSTRHIFYLFLFLLVYLFNFLFLLLLFPTVVQCLAILELLHSEPVKLFPKYSWHFTFFQYNVYSPLPCSFFKRKKTQQDKKTFEPSPFSIWPQIPLCKLASLLILWPFLFKLEFRYIPFHKHWFNTWNCI